MSHRVVPLLTSTLRVARSAPARLAWAHRPARRVTRVAAACLTLALALAAPQWVDAATATSSPVAPSPSSLPSAKPVDPQLSDWTRQAFEAYQSGQVAEAQRLYRRAAQRGDPTALFNAAVIRLSNESRQPSQRVAVGWLRRSAQAGFAPAQYLLGSLLDNGHLLVTDRAQACDWYRRAALQGHGDAALALGTLYFVGSGIAQDDAQAARWYRQAAEAGDVGAQYLVASMLEHGHGVARDLEQALHWYTAAARQGDEAAAEKAKAISRTLAAERRAS